MKRILCRLAMVALAGTFAGCSATSGSLTSTVPVSVTNITATSSLQFAAGTANIGGQPGLNVVATLRQPNGLSAVAYSTPVITWTGGTGPNPAGGDTASNDFGKNQISGHPASAGVAGKPDTTDDTFGAGGGSFGVFGAGIFPGNSNQTGGFSATPNAQPFYGAGAGAFGPGGDSEVYAGGPPAFPADGLVRAPGVIGAILNFQTFLGIVPVAPTTFTLSALIPTVSPIVKSATLTSSAVLPLFAPPTLVLDGAGGGNISYVLPAGVTQAFLFVVNETSNCQSNGGGSTIYTVVVAPGSPNPIPLGDNLGPKAAIGKTPGSTHTICTAADNAGPGDSYHLMAAGFDYNDLALTYPTSNGQQNPPMPAQADITLSQQGPTLVSP